MLAEVKEEAGIIRGVTVRRIDIVVEGHTIEQILLYDVAEAEKAHNKPFDEELDRHIQMGMFAIDRISADGTMGKVAAAIGYALDGKCIRTTKIEHCSDIAPMSSGWHIVRPDGSEIPQDPWSCVKGTAPIPHECLLEFRK